MIRKNGKRSSREGGTQPNSPPFSELAGWMMALLLLLAFYYCHQIAGPPSVDWPHLDRDVAAASGG